MYLKNVITKSTRSYLEDIKILKNKIETSDSIIVGAGAGLSTSAGFIYNGDMFKKYMFDFINEYGITDFYSGGFYPFPKHEIMWAFWSRNIYINRYMDAPKDTYKKLLNILERSVYEKRVRLSISWRRAVQCGIRTTSQDVWETLSRNRQTPPSWRQCVL